MTHIRASFKLPVNTGDSGGARQPCASVWALAALFSEHYGQVDQIPHEQWHQLALLEVELCRVAERYGIAGIRFGVIDDPEQTP
jgi:hypothetical protein